MALAAHMSATPIWTEAADGVAVRKTTGEAEKAQDCETSESISIESAERERRGKTRVRGLQEGLN